METPNDDIAGPERRPELPARFDFEVRDSDDRSGTGGVLPGPGQHRPRSPALGEVGWQIAGLEKLELRDIEFAILAVALGLRSTDPEVRGIGWRAAEILAEMLPLYLRAPTPLSLRAAAIMLAIRRSRLHPVEILWRLSPGEAILLVEEDHPTRARKRKVAYLPFASPGQEMAWRKVPENLEGSPTSLVPWNWTWIAYLFGYLIPAAKRYAEALQEVGLTPALSLDAEGDSPDSLHERVSFVANTPARAFENIVRNEIDKGLSQSDRALYVVFHEYDCELERASGRRRDTLRRAISRMRERARKIRARGHGFEGALEALEELQGFNPLELPRRPGDSLHSQAWKRDAQALRRSSVDLDPPKMRSGKPVHPLLTPSELKSLQNELSVALRGERNLGSWDECPRRPSRSGEPSGSTPRKPPGDALEALDPHFHLDSCPCGSPEWVREGMCWAYHKMMCPSSPTVEQGVFFDYVYRPYACASGSTGWVRGGKCWECRQRKEQDMSVALLEEVKQEARQDREERREFETALLTAVGDLYRMWLVAFWGRPPSQEAEDILAQEGEVEAS